MSATDVVALEAMTKEMWPNDRLEKQYWVGNKLISELEKQKPIEVSPRGAVAAVQIASGGGVSMVPETGTNELNEAAGVKLDRATWKLRRIRNAVEFDSAIVKQVSGSPKSAAKGVDLEVEDNLSTMRAQLTRQVVGDASGIICQLGTNTTTTTLKLATTGSKYALGREVVRNSWLPIGQQIDIGTAGSEASIADGVKVLSVNDSEAEPSFKISGSNVTTSGSHFVSIRNARSGETSLEINGFRNFAAQTGALGEIDPAEVPQWKGAFAADMTGKKISRDMVISARRVHKTRCGDDEPADWAFTSPEVVQELENETFQAVRYDDPGKQNLGDGETVKIGSLAVHGLNECPIGDFTLSIKKYIFALREGEPYWTNELFGSGMFTTSKGSTNLYGDMEYFVNICLTKRKSIAQIQNLEVTADTDFSF